MDDRTIVLSSTYFLGHPVFRDDRVGESAMALAGALKGMNMLDFEEQPPERVKRPREEHVATPSPVAFQGQPKSGGKQKGKQMPEMRRCRVCNVPQHIQNDCPQARKQKP